MPIPQILIVDDEKSIRLALETGLTLEGFTVKCARSGREAIAFTRSQVFDAVICDVFMPDGDGLSFVRELRLQNSHIPIIFITAQGSLELTVQAIAEGATDFIAKPFEVGALAELLRRYIAARREAENVEAETEAFLHDFSRSGLIGRSPAMINAYKLVAHAARSDATVLITGESGTGKELVARAVHNLSPRADRPFIAVNCSGLTDTILEAELFGHTRGAFTGATNDRAGLFEAAEGGTLFLDELASTSAAFQASLLRVLQSGEVRRVGSTQSRRVNVRVLGASNAPLRQLIGAEKFRADLFYRLSVLNIDLPPLRERPGDIELLAQHILRRLAEDRPSHLTKEAMDALCRYRFPGNVRELENALIRALALATDRVITLDCLPSHIAQGAASGSSAPSDSAREIVADRPTMNELQRRYLQLVLTEAGGNRRRAAAVLSLDRRTIQRLIAKYQLAGLTEPETEADLKGDDDEGPETP
ncbi:MAG TPA: sigma-54 dependent transcriptional regulator [Blastocatellia bacterium]|nr:sigma-54 dependent transcriptional regulator [Blastocatellia bacterium]